MIDRLFAVVNPTAGSGRTEREWPDIRERWRNLGIQVEEAWTGKPGQATEIAAEAARGGETTVVAVGGDGTVNEVANGLLGGVAEGGAAKEGGPEGGGPEETVTLGVLPLGSGNDFVKALGTPTDAGEAADHLPTARPRTVDVGRINDRYFLNGVGAGFDARVALRARGIPWLRGTALYGSALVAELIVLRTPDVRVTLDGREIVDGRVTLVTTSNGTTHGGGFHLCPEASVDDGELDLLVVEAQPRRRVLGFLVRSLKGAHGGRPGVRFHRGKRVEINTNDPLPVHVDGEILGESVGRLDMEILPSALTVLA